MDGPDSVGLLKITDSSETGNILRAKHNINDEIPEIPTWSSESEYFFIMEKEHFTFALLRLNPYIYQNIPQYII